MQLYDLFGNSPMHSVSIPANALVNDNPAPRNLTYDVGSEHNKF